MGNWIDREFNVPEGLTCDEFRLRMLTVNDVVQDYDAVMTSRDEIKGVFGPDSDWPRADLTLEQDLIDLGWHQKEFQRRSSFAYTVMSPDESRCLGCVYIYPADKTLVDAIVIMWARTGSDLHERLFKEVRQWISTSWTFKHVAYPGLEISWSEWLHHENDK